MVRMCNGYTMSSNVKRDHHTWTRNTVKNVSGDVTLDIDGSLTLDCGTGETIDFTENGSLGLSLDPNSEKIVSTSGFTIDATTSIDLDVAATAGAGGIYFTNGGIAGGNWFGWIDIMNKKQIWMYDVSNEFNLTVAANGATTLATVDSDGAVGHLTLDIDGDITLDAAGDNIKMLGSGGLGLDFIQAGAGGWTIKNLGQDRDVIFNVNDGGVDTEVMRLDGSESSLLIADGKQLQFSDAGEYISSNGTDLTIAGGSRHILLNPASTVIVGSGKDLAIGGGGAYNEKLFLDGGDDTYILEAASNIVRHAVGGIIMLELTYASSNGYTFNFKNCSAGFVRREATFSTTTTIGSAGTDDTDIDFRFTNKFRLEMTGDITNMNLIFPAMSGNFLLVCTTNGDHDVTNWKVYDSTETAATTADVLWSGGSVPAFTSSGVDIVSFYWDNNEQQCYGVASLAFATP